MRDKQKTAAAKRAARARDGSINERERKRRRRNTGRPTSDKRKVSIGLSPANPELVEALNAKCAERLSNKYLSMKCCCVCDCLHPVKLVEKKHLARCKVLAATMKTRLKCPGHLPPNLRAQYDVSDISECLSGVLLSRRGIICAAPQVYLQVCKPCLGSLSKKNVRAPPKFAIANGQWVGELPARFGDSSMTEHAMVNLSQPTQFMSIVQGGRHYSIRSHAYFFRSEPAPPAAQLPNEVVSSGVIGVSMVGCMTATQKAKTLRRYSVRIDRISEQLAWYKSNNVLYRSISVLENSRIEALICQTQVVLDTTRDDESGVDEQTGTAASVSTTRLENELDKSHWRHSEPRPAHFNALNEVDEEFIQSVTALVTDFANEDDVQLQRRVLENNDIIVRRSSGILSDFDTAFWTNAFCELFPCGRGGLDEARITQISLEEFVRYGLRLASRRFAQHPSFVLVAFDVIARHRAIQAVYLRAKVSPSIMRSITNVDRDKLLKHVSHFEARRTAILGKTRIPDPPTVSQPVLSLMSAISTGLRAFFGSNEERGQARSKVMSMQLRFGQPAIFLTISPSSSLSYRVANLAGSMVDELLDETTVTLQDCLAYTNARLGEIATSNPAACASYFNYVMEVLVEVILNWDVEKQCAKPGQGLFGITEAFISSTEAQGSTGNLHAHMLIWVRGAAKTVDEYYASCRSSLVKQKLVQYVESIASSSFPIKPAACPKCGQTSLAASSFPAEAFQKPRKNSNRPVTSTCSHCSFSFGADDLIRIELNRVASLHQIEQHDWDDQAVRHFLAVPCSYPLPSSTRLDLVACRALIEYQVHHWYHCRSCFKRTRRTPDGKACRMFFPKEAQTETEWRNDKVELCRDVGSEYLNTYIPLLSAVFKCNHDVKFLAAAEGPEKAYYMMKYTTKGQNSIENPLAIHLHAFDKAKLKMAECDNAIASGRRCVQSMCCPMSNAQEVSAPLAALYLERKSPFYSSTDFQRLHLASAAKTVFENGDVDVMLSLDDRGATFKLSSPIFDYIYRPVEVEDICLFDFTSLWEKKKNNTGFHFDNRHTQHQSHSLHKRNIPVTLWLLGKRFPDIRGQLVPDEEKLYFARSVLILFHPFRSLDDFCIDSTRGINARFDHWWEHDATEEAHLFVSHSNDYFASKRLAQQCVDSDMIRYRNAVEQNVGGSYSSSDESESDNHGSDFDDGFSSDEDTATLQRSDSNIRLLNLSVAATTLAASSTESPGLSAFQSSCTTLDEIDECIANAERNFVDRGAVLLARTSTGLLPAIPTQVLLVQNAIIADAELWIDPTTQTSVLPEFAPPNASLRCISTRFSLNRKQHKAFVRIVSPFLRSLVEEIHHSPGQVISFLGGPPGAGKSLVLAKARLYVLCRLLLLLGIVRALLLR